MLEIVYLVDKDQVDLTESFRIKAFEKVKQIIELSKNPDGSITDSDEDIIGRAVVLVLAQDYKISRMKELYNMTDIIIKILTIKNN